MDLRDQLFDYAELAEKTVVSENEGYRDAAALKREFSGLRQAISAAVDRSIRAEVEAKLDLIKALGRTYVEANEAMRPLPPSKWGQLGETARTAEQNKRRILYQLVELIEC
ncbi:hypothetical protein [Glycomyces buryatensis]|uniref:Uncharacterized protein n=1 Tax=Glycomyces buryatensis TaxID=2570927 RepID=A0A4S8QCF1_9ACTN|nr:hypothetical protein [Glycomyces buryatensis]THV40555.1 hypothetical protein FAB82_14915 [Glycomyces buryatensis]